MSPSLTLLRSLEVGIFFGWGFEILALSYLKSLFLSSVIKIDVS